ncbi:MAG: fructose-bisphosphatase class II, partial [Chthoniobacteraceae bacterium]
MQWDAASPSGVALPMIRKTQRWINCSSAFPGNRYDRARNLFQMESYRPSLSLADPERTIEFEFVRATENAALNSLPWLGRGEKELADAAPCDAIYGVFDLVDIAGEVVIGEGIKDNAPGI